MSVLRKRSPWIIPAVGLTAGLLALGLTGCGGGGTETLPTNPAINNIGGQTGGTPGATAAGSDQGTTLTVTTDSNTSGGLTGVTVTANPGQTSLNGVTLGIQTIPKSDSAIQKLVDAGAGGSVKEVLGTFTFGAVGSDGKIDLSRPIVFAGQIALQISVSDLQDALNSGEDTITVAVYDANGNLTGYKTYTKDDIQGLIDSAQGGVVTINIPSDTVTQGYFVLTGGKTGSTTGHAQGGLS
jgi:hypothetical protein